MFAPLPFPFDTLWSQIRCRAWMWLFNRRQLEAASASLRTHIEIRSVTMVSPLELDVRGEVGRSSQTFHEPILRLRLSENGDLHLTTQCTCHSGSLCEHAAALMMICGEEKWQKRITQMARVGDASLQGRTHSGTATSADNAVAIANDQPRPLLKLRRMTLELPAASSGKRSTKSGASVSIGVAEPLVEYEGCPFLLQMLVRSQEKAWQDEMGRSVVLRRNVKHESLFLADLAQFQLQPLLEAVPELQLTKSAPGLLTVPLPKQGLYWARFLRDLVPMLEQDGWTVEIAPDFGFAIHQAAENTWFTDLQPSAGGQELYAFDVGIEIAGQRVSVVPLLVDCIDQGLTTAVLEQNPDRDFLLTLPGPGNPVLSVPAARLVVLLRFLDELLATRPLRKDGKLQIDKLRAAQLASMEGLPLVIPEVVQALRDRLGSFTGLIDAKPPAGLRAELRPYQLEGVSWLQFLREFGLHGVLADDMGLGKTLQTLAHLLIEKEAGRMDRPSLILAPTSVLRNWAREAAKFTPHLHVLLLHGEERRSEFRRIPKYDLVITSYPLLVRDAEDLAAIDWHVVALDEAQNIKNHRSKAAQVAGTLKARHRLCLTGTPMENHLGELWSLFHFLMPGLLGDPETFRVYYRTPIERDQDLERQQQLSSRLQPLLLRRTKSAVAKDLPPKTEILQTIELGKAQTDLYETIRAAMDKRVREAISAQGLDRSQIVVLDALLKLRQVCCHPTLLKIDAAQKITESAKTSFLMDELLPELIDEGHRVLIFSQFTEMLGVLEELLKKAGTPYVKLTGDTRDRETPINRFQKGEVPLFLISLKAGGAGLNLTTADTVIHYDPWWNPAIEAQASDRAHRIGQTKPVFVHKLICANTIEERIVEMQKSKAALVESLLSGRTDKLRLTAEDIQRLLEA